MEDSLPGEDAPAVPGARRRTPHLPRDRRISGRGPSEVPSGPAGLAGAAAS